MEAKIRLTREKLIAAVGVMADELIGQINSECDALLGQVRPPPNVIVRREEGEMEEDDEDDEELQSADSFIDDAPESVSSSSSSSSSSSESDQDVEKPQTKAKLPPPVHYKMNPSAGKRERKAPVRFSPPAKNEKGYSGKRGRVENEDSDSMGEDLTRKRGKSNKSDQEHWNMVRKLGKAKRERNPWWRTKVLEPLRIVRAGLGMESAKNTGPRQLWDDIEADPENVDIQDLSHATRTKCAFCGTTKYCNRTLEIGGSFHLMGSSCARVAEAWRNFCQTLEQTDDFADVDAALYEIQKAHAGKRHKDDDDDDDE